MAQGTYSAAAHERAYNFWLVEGSFRAVSRKPGMPSAPTLIRWSKPDYECPHNCPFHGWEEMQAESSSTDVTLHHISITSEVEQEIIATRRKDQLELRNRGGTRDVVHRTLIAKYGCSGSTLDDDWRNRGQWILDVSNLRDMRLAAGGRMSEYQTTNATRWSIANMYQEVLQDWRRRKAQERDAEGLKLQPEDMKEIGAVVYYLDKLLGAIDNTTNRAMQAAVALGLGLDMTPADDSGDYIDIDGQPTDVAEFIDRLLGAVPDEELPLFLRMMDVALASPEEGRQG